ncbi:MAG: AAC(3)-I family aminoglycoside N-acetyltransferase [Sphingobium sp.]|nr:AAC(3)-I family aminoglycoside N-acetyltransferase [Sphingobium sp.]
MTICRLGPSDVDLMRKLNRLFGRAFADTATFENEPPGDGYLSDLLGREHIAVVVALKDGEVTGGLVAYALDKFEKARREYYIYDLAVDEGYRRQGIATALIRHLRDLAAERGAWVVYVQADYGDEPAIALYEKLGVREEVLHFDIAVDPNRSRPL